MLHTALPDLHVTIDDLFTSDDKVAVRITIHGTHKGDLLGLAPTGRSMTWTGIDIYRVAEGKIAEGWAERDRLGMRQQVSGQTAPRTGLSRARSRLWSQWQMLHTQVQLYRALRPAAGTWRELPSLLRFVLTRFAVGNADHRETSVRLDGPTTQSGWGRQRSMRWPSTIATTFMTAHPTSFLNPAGQT